MSEIDLDVCFYVNQSSIHGQGLYAKIALNGDEFLGSYEGPETTRNDTYVLWVEEDDQQWIGRDGKNLLRYLNHSSEPNAEFDGFDLYALRDISIDEEITIHYGEEFAESLLELV